ncbi:HDOD domain-containing protein [Paucibacter sp. B2R-40]|uniref:HDOD domain-containing protein n=1 Tax=Paucibacter sp. B2R-40 TaxID=2893554 RepID=UPI0021E358A1|nr:HDOD domain-containing protein [Paucibacter sp. B2R-40]MCV2355705.1 HDOD domain-containing protein [Paucibacter sp. B2R-40]
MNFIDDVMSGRVTLPMVPRVVEHVLRSIRSDDVSLHKIAEELEQDPVLSSRVLRLANSSYFAGRRSLSSISDAVGMIGFRSLETLVVASGAVAAFSEVPAVNLRQFWMMATITAASGRQIAARLGVDREAAYTAGLLQGVGHLILCQCKPAAALAAFPGYRSYWGRPLADLERQAFGVAHPAISALWVDRLAMPPATVEAIAHSLEDADADAPRLGRVVQLACSVAAAVSAGASVAEAVATIDAVLLEMLALEDYVVGADFADDFAELKVLPSPL